MGYTPKYPDGLPDQPKPATGEPVAWTYDQLMEKYEDAGLEISELHKQLAVERDRVKHLFNLYLWTDQELKELKAKVK